MAQGKHSSEGLAHDKQYLEMKKIATNRTASPQDNIDIAIKVEARNYES